MQAIDSIMSNVINKSICYDILNDNVANNNLNIHKAIKVTIICGKFT